MDDATARDLTAALNRLADVVAEAVGIFREHTDLARRMSALGERAFAKAEEDEERRNKEAEEFAAQRERMQQGHEDDDDDDGPVGAH